MAITASGMYGLSLEKFFIDTLGDSLEAEDNKVLMVTDSHTPNFDTHDFRNDITNEVTGTGYSAGGQAYTGTELTISSGSLVYDFTDPAWTSSTIASAMASVYYRSTGTDSTDELFFLHDFVTAASTTNGTFTIQIHATGAWILDYSP